MGEVSLLQRTVHGSEVGGDMGGVDMGLKSGVGARSGRVVVEGHMVGMDNGGVVGVEGDGDVVGVEGEGDVVGVEGEGDVVDRMVEEHALQTGCL